METRKILSKAKRENRANLFSQKEPFSDYRKKKNTLNREVNTNNDFLMPWLNKQKEDQKKHCRAIKFNSQINFQQLAFLRFFMK